VRGAIRLVCCVVIGVALGAGAAIAAPAAAPSAVATKLQLRGHLPDLGEAPAMWVFTTAAAYDSFRVQNDVADVFPDSGSLYMTFDKELLALYTRGSDDGGRCLRAGAVSAVVGTTVVLDLSWDASSCGAPASAHYPFALASLSRSADDGSAWISGRQVCAAAPGVDGSRACAPAAGGTASPSPSSSASPTPTPSPAPTASPSPTATVAATTAPAAPTATITSRPSPTTARSASPSASPTAVVAGSSESGGNGPLDIIGWLAVGLILGVFVTALVMRPRVVRV
jgi:hypothetical protein